MNKSFLLPLTILILLPVACAKSGDDTTGAEAKEYIEKWMDKYHNGVQANENGIYILEDVPGTGLPRNEEEPFVLLSGTIRTLEGTVSSTTEEEVARQLGTFQYGNFYGPQFHYLNEGYSYAGMDLLLKDMRIGGHRKAVIPAWLLTSSRYSTQEEYIQACSSSTHLIYDITLVNQCGWSEGQEYLEPDIAVRELHSYIDAHYPGTESVSYETDGTADGTFYFISDISAFKEEDKLSDDSSVKINYTGKLLDGTVFDTSIRKVAVDARIDSDSKSYEPQSATITSTYSEVTMGDSSSLINGFKGALSLMQWKGQKAVAVFSSRHGYGSSGSGNAIPAYAPLVFEIEILPDE